MGYWRFVFDDQDLYAENNNPIEDWWAYDIKCPLLDLRGCSSVKTLSKMSGSIKYIFFRSTAIKELHSSICSLYNLIYLNLKDCKWLKNLPSNICDIGSLQCLDLGGCISIDKFPVLPQNLRNLNLSGTSIEQVDESSFNCLPDLKFLIMNNCTRLETLPASICKLKSLRILSLSSCLKFNNFPEILEPMENLYGLFLDETGIKELPSSIENLNGLAFLNLRNCQNLRYFPFSIYNKIHLRYLCLLDCPRLKCLPTISFDNGDFILKLSYSNILKLRDWSNDLSFLEMLDPSGTTTGRIPIRIRYVDKCITSFMICKCFQSSTTRWTGKLIFYQHFDGDHCNVGSTMCTRYWCKILTPFSYCGCLNFDEVCNILMTEFQLNVLHRATAFVFKHGLQEADHPRINFSYPGNKIPEWFIDQTMGSSIDINFSPLRHDTSFLGFALCIIVAWDDLWDCNIEYSDLSCEYHFKTKDGESHQYHWTLQRRDCFYDGDTSSNYPCEFYMSSHVFMWHLYEEDYQDYHDATGALFKFYMEQLDDSIGLRARIIKECGIRRLTLQDAEEFGIIEHVPAQNINSNTYGPHGKRTKISN